MSPEGPRFHSSETDKDEKDKKRKKRASFAAPVPVDTTERPAEKPKCSALGEAMDRLDATKREAAEKKAAHKAPEAEKPVAEQSPVETEQDGAEASDETDSADEAYEALPNQEIEPNEFSGGEVVIRLQGDEPVAERVIPLHAESHSEDPSPKHSEPESSTPIFQHSEQSVPRPETPAAAGGGGELPPPPPPEAPASVPEPPEPERSVPIIQPPVEILHRQQAEADMGDTVLPNIAPVGGERPATKEEVEDALHRSAKFNAQRGALSGLLVGTWFANRGLRRRQKQERAELNRQGKQLEQVTTELHTVRRAQEKQRATTEQRFSGVEKRFENPSRPERVTAARDEKLSSAEEPTEQWEIPKDHHLETSAWHTIEVDSRTGKPVENPTFSYGHEYYQERAHEAAPKDQRNAAAGEVALVAAAMAGESVQGNLGQTASGSIPLATAQGPPRKVAAARRASVPSQPPAAKLASTGPLWPWLLALLVVIICLIAAIH